MAAAEDVAAGGGGSGGGAAAAGGGSGRGGSGDDGGLSLMEDEQRMFKCLFCRELLEDPMLLDCLHSCCRKCLQHPDGQTPEKDGSIRCEICDLNTKPEDVTENHFLAGQVQSMRLMRGDGGVLCDTCDDEDDDDGEAESSGSTGARRERKMADLWCDDCHKAICNDCLAWHDRFNPKHQAKPLEAMHDASSVAAPPVLCPKHRKSYDFMCFGCDIPKCPDCLTECSDKRHDVQPMQSERVEEYARKVRKDLGELHQRLVGKANDLRKCNEKVEEEAEKNRRECLEELQKNKRTAIDAVETAYKQAEEEWQQKCDEMLDHALKLQDAVEKLNKHGQYVILYTTTLLQSEDKISLLQQEKRILDCIQKLTEEAEKLDKELDEVDKYVVVGELPENLEKIMQEWVGIPMTKKEAAAKEAAREAGDETGVIISSADTDPGEEEGEPAAAGEGGGAAGAAAGEGGGAAGAAAGEGGGTAGAGRASEGGAGAAEDIMMDRAMGGLIADMQRNIIDD